MQTVVGVLRGGPSREHDVSLKTGAAILANLPSEKYVVRDIYIDKNGQWHDRGRPTSPERVLRQVDVALIGLHGEYGGDGEVQKLLELFGVPYAGADSFGSYLATHKLLAKARARDAGLLTPVYRYIESVADSEAVAREIIHSFAQPVIVKPVGWGSSVGVSLVGGYAPVLAAIEKLFAEGAPRRFSITPTVASFPRMYSSTNTRGEALYVLPPIEIIPHEGGIFSYDAKYTGKARQVCPGNFSRVAAEELRRVAKVMHRALDLRHYSRSDFIVAPKGVYYLETNTLPGLTSDSLLQKSLAAVGVPFPDFLGHLVNLAQSR